MWEFQWFRLFHHARRKGFVDQRPHPRMVGWVRVDQTIGKVLLEGLQLSPLIRREPIQRSQHASLAGKVLRIAQGGEHIVIARDQPGAYTLTPDHRRFLAQLGIERIEVVGKTLGREAVGRVRMIE